MERSATSTSLAAPVAVEVSPLSGSSTSATLRTRCAAWTARGWTVGRFESSWRGTPVRRVVGAVVTVIGGWTTGVMIVGMIAAETMMIVVVGRPDVIAVDRCRGNVADPARPLVVTAVAIRISSLNPLGLFPSADTLHYGMGHFHKKPRSSFRSGGASFVLYVFAYFYAPGGL